MAIWQYHVYLLPRAPFQARFGDGREPFVRDVVLDETNAWPDEMQAQAVLRDLTEILPEMLDYWDKGSKAWGNYDTDIIEAEFHDGRLEAISFRVNVGKPNVAFIQTMIELSKRHDLLLFTEDNVALAPDLRSFVAALQTSHAFRFLQDPEEFLNTIQILP